MDASCLDGWVVDARSARGAGDRGPWAEPHRRRLDSSQFMRHEADAHFDLALFENGSGWPAFQRGFEDGRVDQGSPPAA